jgi:hypothetical protein
MKGESSVCDATLVLIDWVRAGVDSEVEARPDVMNNIQKNALCQHLPIDSGTDSCLFLRLRLKTRLACEEVGDVGEGTAPPTLLLSLSTVFSTTVERRLTLETSLWVCDSTGIAGASKAGGASGLSGGELVIVEAAKDEDAAESQTVYYIINSTLQFPTTDQPMRILRGEVCIGAATLLSYVRVEKLCSSVNRIMQSSIIVASYLLTRWC